MSVDIGPVASEIASRTLSILKVSAKASWDSWTDAEKKLVERVAEDAARVAVLALTDPKRAEVEQPLVNAALENIKVAGQGTASMLMWDVIAKILEAGLTIILKAI